VEYGTSGEYRLSNGIGTSHWSMYSTTGGSNTQGNWELYSAGKTGGAGSVLQISPVGAFAIAVTPITDPYTATGGGWKTIQLGKGGILGAYGTDNESMSGFNTYVATDGSNKAIISNIGGTAIRYYEDRITFNTLSTSGTAQTQTERVRITNDGYLRLAGAGIQFNGDTAAANSLDDYEEGTFTATVVGGTTAGVGTYSRQVGVYTKIGNLVTTHVWIQWSAHTGTGDLFFGGFPFTSTGTTNYRAS